MILCWFLELQIIFVHDYFLSSKSSEQIPRHPTVTRVGRFMAGSAPQVFNGVTPDSYARLVDKARGAGIEMKGNSGTASKFGIEIAWRYSPEAQELTVQW